MYQPDSTVQLEVMVENETVWLSQSQMVSLFQRDVSVISRHIRNIFKEGELPLESNLHFLQIANSDRPVAYYSLDVIISVGYRVKSKRGTEFRIWATKVLKDYLYRGYAFSQRMDRVENQLHELSNQVQSMVQTALPPKQGVSAIIGVSRLTDAFRLDVERHNKQYPPVEVLEIPAVHDRFLLIDGTRLYTFGASLKDLGKKLFCFSLMENPAVVAAVRQLVE